MFCSGSPAILCSRASARCKQDPLGGPFLYPPEPPLREVGGSTRTCTGRSVCSLESSYKVNHTRGNARQHEIAHRLCMAQARQISCSSPPLVSAWLGGSLQSSAMSRSIPIAEQVAGNATTCSRACLARALRKGGVVRFFVFIR